MKVIDLRCRPAYLHDGFEARVLDKLVHGNAARLFGLPA